MICAIDVAGSGTGTGAEIGIGPAIGPGCGAEIICGCGTTTGCGTDCGGGGGGGGGCCWARKCANGGRGVKTARRPPLGGDENGDPFADPCSSSWQ